MRAPDPDSPVEPTARGVRIRLHIQPRASRTESAGLHGGALKLRLAAPPVDGAANDALVRWIADALGVARGAVTLTAGAGRRAKTVEVVGAEADDVRRRLGLQPA